MIAESQSVKIMESGRQLLTNYLRHVGSHNRVQEEREMWRQRRLEREQSHYDRVDRPQRSPPLVRGHLVSDTLSPSRSPKQDTSPPSYYWTRQLMKEEESDPFRWGHSGYKELHPEEFESGDDGRGVKEKQRSGRKQKRKQKNDKRHKKKRKKRARPDYSSSEDEARSCKSRKVQELRTKARKRDSSDSDSFISEGISTQSRKKLSSSRRARRESKGKSKARKGRSSQEIDSSVSSDSYSDSQSSYTDYHHPKRKRRKNG